MVVVGALHKNLPSTSVDVAATKGWLDSANTIFPLPNSPQGLRFRPDHDISIQAIPKGENKQNQTKKSGGFDISFMLAFGGA
jgi:hypothetical protein